MKDNFTWIVEIFLNKDRIGPDGNVTLLPKEYVKSRIKFFQNYTFRSIINQTDKNFRVFIQTGNTWNNLMQSVSWHPNITLCYDGGEKEYKKIDTDYLSITRIDSDDLFYKDAIACVKTFARKNINKEERTVLVFRENLVWDMVNGFIGPHVKDFINPDLEDIKPTIRKTNPFYTHIFPKKIYKDWGLFKSQHFVPVGQAGEKTGITLPKNKICVTRHNQNWSALKRNIPTFVLTPTQREKLMTNKYVVFNKEKITKILKEFGVKI